MAVLRENVPLLDQCITLFAGHQTSDPVGKRWAQRRGFSPELAGSAGRAWSEPRYRYSRPVRRSF